MRSDGVWLESRPEVGVPGPVAAWTIAPDPDGPARRSRAVLLLPAIGYAYSSSHHQLRAIAEGLAGEGFWTLRLDYWGTGDSEGALEEVMSLEPWRQSVGRAVEALREAGAVDVVIVGIQWGAVLGTLEAADLGVAAVVRIAPVDSGRRFARGIRMRGREVPGGRGDRSDGGFVLTGPLLEEMSRLEVAPPVGLPTLEIPPGRAVGILERPAEEAEVDDTLTDEVVAWLADDAHELRAAPGVAPTALGPREAVLRVGTGFVHEEFVVVGPDRLRGILTRGSGDGSAIRALYVLVNSGSDPHIGPGRAWTELARSLSASAPDLDVLRLDLPGWGESESDGLPGRPYDEEGILALGRLVPDLRATWDSVVLGGLCAGAWTALDLARADHGVDGAVVLNPQLYWKRGDPVEALMSTTRARRSEEIGEIARDRDKGRWDAEDAAGLRPPAAEWLDRLVDLRRPVSLVFAEGDDGLEYLRDRLGRRLAAAIESGVVRVVEVPEIDHGMQATWLRPRMFEVIRREVERAAVGGRTRS